MDNVCKRGVSSATLKLWWSQQFGLSLSACSTRDEQRGGRFWKVTFCLDVMEQNNIYCIYIYIYIYKNSRMKQLSWYHNDGNRVACSGMIFSYFLEKNISTKPLHCLNFFSAKSRHLVWPTCRKKTENRKWCHREDTPQHTCLEVSSIPSKTLISCFRCVWLGLELNSAGTPALQDRTWWPLV